MSISIRCPGCEKNLTAKEELVGKRVKCPACGTLIPVAAKASVSTDEIKSGSTRPEKKTPRPTKSGPTRKSDNEGADSPTAPATPSMVPMLLLMGVMFLIFGVSALFAGLGQLSIVTGPISLVALIVACVAGARVQKHVVRMYPIRAQTMLAVHLEPGDGDLAWVYGMTGPSAFVNLLLPFNNLSKSGSVLVLRCNQVLELGVPDGKKGVLGSA